MDFERASIVAILADYPLDLYWSEFSNKRSLSIDFIAKTMCSRHKEFSLNESRTYLYSLIGNKKSEIFALKDLIHLLTSVSNDLLNTNNSQPVVNFGNLLRWHELCKYIGEDVLACCYLANIDNNNRTDFSWKEPLLSDDQDIISIVSNSADIHHHMSASADAFNINWIFLMNNIEGAETKKVFDNMSAPLASPVIIAKEYRFTELYQWCIIAARIRLELYYSLTNKGDTFGKFFIDEIRTILHYSFHNTYIKKFQGRINYLFKDSLKSSFNLAPDYAISNSSKIEVNDSPFSLFSGERWLEYSFFRRYKLSSNIGPFFFLYLLIKNNLRREMKFSNEFKGLDNFQEYDARSKFSFISSWNNSKLNGKDPHNSSEWKELAISFGLQSSLFAGWNNAVETRIPISQSTTIAQVNNWQNCLFNKQSNAFDKDVRLSFVVSFSKTKNNGVISQKNKIDKLESSLRSNTNLRGSINGIDALGNELSARPEKFGHAFRYFKSLFPNSHITFHVGEEFNDIVDGLRSIDEAYTFFEMKEGDRLGHCLALGINSVDYYINQHYSIVIDKQTLLDNMIWLLYTAKKFHCKIGKTNRDFIKKYISALYKDIYGKNSILNERSYFYSLFLRSDDEIEKNVRKEWNEVRLCKLEDNSFRNDLIAKKYYKSYQKLIKSGKVLDSIVVKVPRTYPYLVRSLQERMIRMLSDKKICIEICPTSNINIGKIKKYEELPLLRFNDGKNNRRNIPITINTDDQGIFGTSIEREYGLVALSIIKSQKGRARDFNKKKVMSYMKKVADYSNQYKF